MKPEGILRPPGAITRTTSSPYGPAFGRSAPTSSACRTRLSDVGRSKSHLQAHKQKHLRKGGAFVCMARLERFERPTAWFVARYSIQLSYRRLGAEHYPWNLLSSQD